MKTWYLGYLSNVCIDRSVWYICQILVRIDIAGELKLVRLLPLFIYDSVKPRRELTGV